MTLERKALNAVDLKLYDPSLEAPAGSFTCYASTFNNFDKTKEAVQPGAFTKSLPKFMKKGFVAVGHDWNGLPAAYPVKAVEDSHGLLVTANFHSTQHGQDARAYVKERLDAGLEVMTSIGYRVMDDENTKEGRLLKELDLHEFSIVNVPANDEAQVVGAKSNQEKSDFKDFESFFADNTVKNQFDFLHTGMNVFLKRLAAIKELRAKKSKSMSLDNTARIGEIRSFANQVISLCSSMERDEIAESLEEIAEGEFDSNDLASDLAEIGTIRQFALQVLAFCGELELEEAGEMGKTAPETLTETKLEEGEGALGEEKQLTANEQEAQKALETDPASKTDDTLDYASEQAEIERAILDLQARIMLDAALEEVL